MVSLPFLLAGCVSVATPAGSLQAPARPALWEPPPEPAEIREPGGLLTQTEFAGELAAELERLRPGWKAVNHGGDAVELWNGEVPGVSLPVGPAYQVYRSNADRRVDVISEAAHHALAVGAVAATWESARGYILPQLVTIERYEELEDAGAMPVYMQLSDEVYLLFDLRVNGTTVQVHQGLQVAWRQPSSALYAAALTNLSERTPPLVKGEDGVWRFPVHDGYEAVRILLLQRFAEVDAEVPGALLIAMPSQDRLYAFESADKALVERIRGRTHLEYQEADHPVTPQWLTIQDGGLTLYQAESDQG